jgi:hypothetical protein
MIQGNVLDHDISDGTVFSVCAAFDARRYPTVFEMIKKVARIRPLRIVLQLLDADWLQGEGIIIAQDDKLDEVSGGYRLVQTVPSTNRY